MTQRVSRTGDIAELVAMKPIGLIQWVGRRNQQTFVVVIEFPVLIAGISDNGQSLPGVVGVTRDETISIGHNSNMIQWVISSTCRLAQPVDRFYQPVTCIVSKLI